LFSVLTNSDTALVGVQYLAIELSALWLVLTLNYFYNPGRLTKWILFVFIIFNPVFLYISNYVSSDSLFLATSLVWFSLLIWILKKATLKLIVIQAIILF